MNKTGALSISACKDVIRIASLEGNETYFNGDEDEAWKVSAYVASIVGSSEFFAYYKGELVEFDDVSRFTAKNAAGLGTSVEVEFNDSSVTRISVSWD